MRAAGSLHAEEWNRLEEIGDLHFHGSAYSSCLDYYAQLLAENTLRAMPSVQALRIVRKSVDAWFLLGNMDAADELLDLAFSLLDDARDTGELDEGVVARAEFRYRRAVVLRERGQLHASLELYKQSFSVLALTDQHDEVARLQVGMGICHWRLGRLEKAEEFYSDGLSTFRRIGNELGVANVLNNLSLLQKNRCRWSQSLGLNSQAVDIAQRIGASHLLPALYLNQGLVLVKTDRFGEARAILDKGLRLAKSLGDRLNCTRLYLATGRLETLAGRLARSEELILEGQALAARNRFLRESVISDEYLGDIMLMRGEVQKARFNYELGLEKGARIASGNDLEAELLRRMGEAHLAAGALDEAIAVSQAAISVCEESSELYELGFCHSTLAKAYAAQNDRQQADHHFREALSIFHEQQLTHLWCSGILGFVDHLLPAAGQKDLLLARRLLMDAQAEGAAAVSDQMLCQVLERLARVQIRLGQFDDALLTVFELERHAAGFDDCRLDRTVVELRDRIEAGFVGGVQLAESNLQAICGIPGLFSGGSRNLSGQLDEVLIAGMERMQADSGFLALCNPTVPLTEAAVAARKGMTENLSRQLIDWFAKESMSGSAQPPHFFSRLDADSAPVQAVPALATVAASCVLMPVASRGKHFGLLFLGKSPGRGEQAAFDRSSLDFLGAYMGFLAMALLERESRTDRTEVRQPVPRVRSFERIVTRNDRMLEILELARKVAPSDLTVLLNGETGTGKGLLAQSLHDLSKRADRRFLSINCAAIPETLLESELFGHVKGSFTGAYGDKRGLLAEAEGGTVFLDEIGKMSLGMQGKMLHFLDTRTVRPVGSNKEFQVDVRILCASKSDLHRMGQEETFLEDLYYRLLDFPLTIPPLRERPDDIPLLARVFVERFSAELGIDPPGLDSSFLDALNGFPWPGNVRELEKALKRIIVLVQGEPVLRREHLPTEVGGQPVAGAAIREGITPLRETLAGIECREIESALRQTGWNRSQAARSLGISYPNLLKKIRHYGLSES